MHCGTSTTSYQCPKDQEAAALRTLRSDNTTAGRGTSQHPAGGPVRLGYIRLQPRAQLWRQNAGFYSQSWSAKMAIVNARIQGSTLMIHTKKRKRKRKRKRRRRSISSIIRAMTVTDFWPASRLLRGKVHHWWRYWRAGSSITR